VIADQSVNWTAASSQAWLTITSSTTGSGNGNINYTVAGNPAGTSRYLL
jgi:hypothetical protein